MSDRPASTALAGGGIRATVVIALRNHAKHIGACLDSLFAQWRPGLHLLLIDDASTDDGFAIAERALARHPHVSATTLRNRVPVGSGLLPTVLPLARGAVVIQAEGDGVALPGRLDAVLACFDADPACRLVTSNAVLMSADGFAAGLYETVAGDEVFTDPLEAASVAGDGHWLGATMAFHRAVFDDFLLPDPVDGLCGLLPFRAVLLGSHHYVSRPLVGWRQRGRPPVASGMQTLRDVEHAHRLGFPKAAGDVVALCRARVAGGGEGWSRAASVAAQDGALPGRGFPMQPPVTTLHAGQRLAFASRFGGAILAGWPGFHPFDGWCVWTQRHAMVCFRVTSPDVTGLRVAVRGLSFVNPYRVSLSAGGGHWTTLELPGDDECLVDLAVERPGIVGLFISAHDAVIPPVGDSRLLGAGLLWVEAMTDPASRPCVGAVISGIQMT